MKFSLLSIILLLSFSSYGHGTPGKKSRLQMSYSILSDEAVFDVPLNRCRIKGRVHSEQSLVGGTVSTLDREKIARTDSLGNYEFLVGTKDTSIFFYKPGLDEIVIWNHAFRGGYEVVIDFWPRNNWQMMEVDKPVIYMYSDQPLTASVSFNFYGNLTFTYPKYEKEWKVEVGESGKLVDPQTQKVYPYLFWEGQMKGLAYQSIENKLEGFLINTDSLISFLENSLSCLGMNENESTDFITFWGPRIIQKDYAFVRFLVDEEYDKEIASIQVTPRPDAMRRVYMLFTSMDSEGEMIEEYIEPKLEGFNRDGFVLLEWGGSEIPKLILP